jgi:hypothetical protein
MEHNSKIGTLYLQCRRHSGESWSTLNQLDFSSDMGFLEAMAQLEKNRAGYSLDHRFIGHTFNIVEKTNGI